MKKRSTQIADELFSREDNQDRFWREYFRACRAGTNTRIMNARAEQLLRRQDLAVKRFLKSIS